MKKSIRQTVADNIKFYRKKAGLTQIALAGKIGKTVEMVSQLENNVSATRLVVVEQIAEALSIEPYQLLLTHEHPEFENLSPQLLRLIAVLQKNSPELTDSFLSLLEQIKK